MQPSATFATANATVSDNLLRNGVIPLNRDATTSKSRARAIELWITIMPFVIYGSFFSKSLFIPLTSLDIVKYFTECASIRAWARSFNIIYLPISRTILKFQPIKRSRIARGTKQTPPKKNRRRNAPMKKDRKDRVYDVFVGGEKEGLGVFSSVRNGASSVRREVNILSGEPRAVISSILAREPGRK